MFVSIVGGIVRDIDAERAVVRRVPLRILFAGAEESRLAAAITEY